MKLNVPQKLNIFKNKWTNVVPSRSWPTLFSIGFILFFPAIAEASITSFISDIFQEDVSASTIVVEDTTSNSQNTPFLHAAVNIDPNPNKGDADITIVSGNSLLPEAGPTGTLVDIQDIPQNTQISTYVVRDGDTLVGIAKLFDVSVNTILWANNLSKSSLLKEGQLLVILPISGIQHVIKPGETLNGITKKYKADIDEVLRYNDLAVSTILIPGEVLTIPDGELTAPATTKLKVNAVRGAGGPSYNGYYIRPIIGGLRSQGLHGNNGVDLANVIGTPIYAAADGTVIVSAVGGWNGGYGNYIVIAHPNGTQTLYSHIRDSVVKVGEHVNQGQTIAHMGTTGKSTGPHVHFEIRGAKNPF